MATTPIKAIERYKKYMSTHNSREVEEEWKAELRKEYRKQTLAMAREVSASGTYEKVEGMICDWWFEKIDHQLQKAREEERERIEAIFKKHVPPHAMDLEDSVWLKRLLNKAFNHDKNI